MLLLGAVLLGTAGLSIGSWYGGRGTVPLSPDRARAVAAELLPEAEPNANTMVVRTYRYGVFLAADDLGSARADFHYRGRANCALSDQLRRNAASLGWQDLHRVPGDPCDGWRAEANGVMVTLTHRATWSTLSVVPAAPDRFLASALIGTLLGAAAGAALFWVVARRRPPVPWLVRTLVTVALLPGAALTWADLFPDGLAEPVWPAWWSLVPLLVPLWLALLLTGLFVLTRRPSPTGPATEATAAVHGTSPRASSGG
ncbi:hypothetical protein Q3W71_10180 [Micromonospora sp. C28SCA-DRY-2]|uniref:hypothetical protein n=1 Tax=Micromonospora sp. C28SCA-DRY-2 TaxID=3059522 RepID=UPI0026760CF5|nr:hypothetical protein [Micromonospora sp. C28SCA-DRY-2]MDO3702043.1 hypothetical protein [Micromonospora sp. C28SCA-DRY-2]